MAKNELDNLYLSSFCMELYLILQAGIPISSGIDMLLDDEDNQLNTNLLKQVHDHMDKGSPLSEALDKTGGFPNYAIRMIEIGEETGNLDTCLKALSVYYTRQEQIYQNIKNAVAYPSILALMMLFVIIVVITKVLPIFNDVFSQLGATMSSFATAILNIGQAINNNFVVFMVIVGIIAVLLIYFLVTKSGKEKLSSLFEKGKMGESIAMANFASAMSMSMQSGLDPDDSLVMANNLCSGTIISQKIENCKKRIADGEAFYTAILNSKLFPSLYCQMLNIGFKTGSSDVVMEEIAKRTEEDVSRKIEQLIGKIEPTLVIVMSLIVGLILISVMLPLMSIMSTIG